MLFVWKPTPLNTFLRNTICFAAESDVIRFGEKVGNWKTWKHSLAQQLRNTWLHILFFALVITCSAVYVTLFSLCTSDCRSLHIAPRSTVHPRTRAVNADTYDMTDCSMLSAARKNAREHTSTCDWRPISASFVTAVDIFGDFSSSQQLCKR